MSANEPTLDEATLRKWVGKTRTTEDRIDVRQASLLKATLDPSRSALRDGDPLPPGWHWIYFVDAPGIDQLGRDGHAALGEFLPPVALPQRMWAGTRLRFYTPILIGEQLRKVSEVVNVARKTGKSGELCFVTVNHKYYSDTDLRLEENHDIVYREDRSSKRQSHSSQVDSDCDTSSIVMPSTTLLFRYSALTFNGHRIHYDLDYCRQVEGYPGLVVHAPLVATLMLGLAEQRYAGQDVSFSEFRQRSVTPLFHDNPVSISLRDTESGCEIWAADHKGRLASSATLALI
jgi:3-methylfumaryl-CoA hydratase